jgi:hypothetical protein
MVFLKEFEKETIHLTKWKFQVLQLSYRLMKYKIDLILLSNLYSGVEHETHSKLLFELVKSVQSPTMHILIH